MSADTVTQVVGFTGLGLSYVVSIPQLMLMLRTKNVAGLSALSWTLLLVVDACYLVRALYIGEAVFILGKLWAVAVVGTQLFLIWRYRKGPPDASKTAKTYLSEDL